MRDPERDDKHRVSPVCRLDHQLRGQRGSQSGGERRRWRRRGGQKVGGGEQRRVLEDYGEAGPAGERRQRTHQRSACAQWCACVESLKSACDRNKHRRSPVWLNLTRMTHLAGQSSHYSHITKIICSVLMFCHTRLNQTKQPKFPLGIIQHFGSLGSETAPLKQPFIHRLLNDWCFSQNKCDEWKDPLSFSALSLKKKDRNCTRVFEWLFHPHLRWPNFL